MQAFAGTGSMRKMAIRAMAREMSGSEEQLGAIQCLQQQFQAIDKDSTGTISLDELKSALEHSMWKVSEAELKQILQGIDLAGEGERRASPDHATRLGFTLPRTIGDGDLPVHQAYAVTIALTVQILCGFQAKSTTWSF